MEELHLFLNELVEIAILFFEFMGVIVLIFLGIRGLADYLRKKITWPLFT
ncbi:MAG: hypothetical protein K0R92_2278 [Lachnospiraceae bacterium]|jgi:uncharacterized membrane protein|nr:hypothetical protein [Lachnospiraceae bacterium]